VDHLGAAVDLLIAVGNRDRIDRASRAIPAARILPGDRRTRFDLRPTNLGIAAATVAPLSDEVINTALAVLVAGVLLSACLRSLDDQKLSPVELIAHALAAQIY
jgi:hypothetical protein